MKNHDTKNILKKENYQINNQRLYKAYLKFIIHREGNIFNGNIY